MKAGAHGRQDPGRGEPEALPERRLHDEAPEGVGASAPEWSLREDGPSGEFLLAAAFLVLALVLAALLGVRRRRR